MCHPTYELALLRQADIRATAAHQRVVREARSASRLDSTPPVTARTRAATAWLRPLRLTAALSRLAGA